MSQLFTNNAQSTLASGITSSATSLTLPSGQGTRFPIAVNGHYFLLTLATPTTGLETAWEIVKVTYRTGDVLTIVRAQELTTAQAWSAGATVELRVTAGTMQTAMNAASNALAPLTPLLIYYGYPVAYKNLWNVNAVIADISSNYKIWVVGDGYQDPGHIEYANTVPIVQGTRAAGVKVYGYVPIGQSTLGLTVDQIKARIDQWVTIGVDGIFLDEFGFDYLNSRTKQIACVDHVHSKGIPIIANAWVAEDVCIDNIADLSYPVGEWRYINFQRENPDNLPLTRWPNDAWLFENFCYSNTGPGDIWAGQEKITTAVQTCATANIQLFALAVFAESAPGVIDTSLTGNLTKPADMGAYISANAYLLGVNVVGVGGFSFGALTIPVVVPLLTMPVSALSPTGPTVRNYVTKTFTRSYNTIGNSTAFPNVTIKISNDSVGQRVEINNTLSFTGMVSVGYGDAAGAPVYLNALMAFDDLRILSGPYTGGYRNVPGGYLNIYLAAQGLLGVVKDRPVETKAFLDLVLNVMTVANDGARGLFVIYDVQNLDTTPALKDPANTDAYAALVLLLAYEYASATGDWAWYSANITRLKDIGYNNLALAQKGAAVPGAGMVRTFQTASWGADYDICQTEDNCEVYAGLNALSKGLTRLGLTADASYYAGVRDALGLGMHDVTYGVWDDTKKNWMVSDLRAVVTGTGVTAFTDAMTQVYPELWAVSSGTAATNRTRYNYGWDKLNAYAPQWETKLYDAYPWLILGQAATLRGAYPLAEAQMTNALRSCKINKFAINELGWMRQLEVALAARGRAPVTALTLVNNETPVAPPMGQTTLFGKRLAGRMLPAWVGPSGMEAAMQPALWRQKTARWSPIGNSATVPVLDGFDTPTALGTATARNVATTNLLARTRRLGYVSAGTAGALAGHYHQTAQHTTGDGAGLGGFFYSCRFAFSDAAAVAGARAFIGMGSSVAAPTNVEPNTLTDSIGIGQLSTDATQLYLFYGGSAAQAAIALGTNFSPMTAAGVTNGPLYEFTLFASPNANGVVGWRLEKVGTPTFVEGTLTPAVDGTQTPASTTLLTPRLWRCNNATALAVGLDIVNVYLETDY